MRKNKIGVNVLQGKVTGVLIFGLCSALRLFKDCLSIKPDGCTCRHWTDIFS